MIQYFMLGWCDIYIYVEKERNAGATAAEEAMAMIIRLQREKAAAEMESRQYQRLIDEKSAYDEEEREILKEIIIRREREKHFLEKEVEAYRREILGEMKPLSEAVNIKMSCMMNFTDECNNEAHEKDIVKMEVYPYEHREHEYENYSGSNSSQHELASNILDVHVIDHKHDISLEENRKASYVSKSGCETDALDIKTPIATFKRSCSEIANGANSLDNRSDKGSSCYLRRSSMSAVDGEIFMLETEVEGLRKRLKTIQNGRESLKFPQEYKEKDPFQLQLFEEMPRQLQEIRKLTGSRKSMHQASLPPLSTKPSKYQKVERPVGYHQLL